MAEMIYANDLKQAMKDAGMLESVKAEVVYKSAWGVPIVDAEEVVRCKDCKYRYTANCSMATLDTDAENDYFIREWTIGAGFCHRGERSTDDSD